MATWRGGHRIDKPETGSGGGGGTPFDPSQAAIYPAAKAILTAGTNITLTKSDSGHTITIDADGSMTADEIRTALGVTAAELNDMVTNATISGQTMTLTQADGSTIALTLPQRTAAQVRTLLGVTADELNNMVVNASISDNTITLTQADGTTLTLTLAEAELGDDVITPAMLDADTTSKKKAMRDRIAVQDNPKHEVKFAAISADTDDGIGDGEIGFYNGNTQVQSGGMSQATRIDVPDAAAAFGVDPSQPSADLDAVDTASLFGDILSNGGQVTLAIVKQGTSKIVYVQAETIAGKTGGYSLTNLTFFNDDTIAGTNDSWNVVAAISHGFDLTKDIVDLAAKLNAYVLKTDLEGHESDRYASYTNAFIAAGDRRGAVCLFTQATGPPTDANAVGQPDIADRSTNGIIALGATLRTDKDPNNLVWATENVAGDYVSGQKIVISIWDKPEARVVVTLTGDGVKVDSGNAAYIYATATWDEVNDIPDVTEVGNYMLISEEEPSELNVRLSAKDILNAPWLDPTGTTITDADISSDTKIMLEDGDDVTVGELYEHHDQNHVGETKLPNYSHVTNTNTTTAGTVAISAPSGGTGAYYIVPRDEADKALLKNILIADKKVRFWVSDSRYIEFRPNGTPATFGNRLVGSYPASGYSVVGAALPNNQAISIEVRSNIPDYDDYVSQVFKDESENVGGKGGAAGKIWAWISSATDAAWKSIVEVLLDAVAPSRADSDRGKVLALKSDDKDALELINPESGSLTVYATKTDLTSTYYDVTALSTNDVIVISFIELSGTERALDSGMVVVGDISANEHSLFVDNPDGNDRIIITRPASPGTTVQIKKGSGLNADNVLRVFKVGAQQATPNAGQVVVDASGFDGNLANTDNTVQKVAQKVDDLSLSDSGTGSLFITATELTGTADAIVGTPSDALSTYEDGQVVYFEAEGTNTGATTINISTLGSKTVVREDGDALQAGDIENGDLVHLVYDGTNFVLMNRARGEVSEVKTYDSGSTTDNTQRTVSDTDAIQGPSLTESAVIETEDITNFGRVYKVGKLAAIKITYTMNATQGVAFRIRYSDTKPTGSSDAKNYGTLCHQANANAEGICTEFDVPANRYFWFALSGGGSRNVNKRDVRVQATYAVSPTPATRGYTYIDSASEVPSSPSTDDIVEVTTAISSGLTAKGFKASDGSTNKDAAAVKDTFEYNGTNWVLKLKETIYRLPQFFLKPAKDIATSVLRSANATINPSGITVDGDGDVLVVDTNIDAVWGFRNGARHSAKDIGTSVLQSANAFIMPSGITVDGDGDVLVVDTNIDAVWGFRNGARHSAKDIGASVLRSANATINPSGITVDGDGDVLVVDDNADSVWGFRNGARHSAKDIGASVLRSANASINPPWYHGGRRWRRAGSRH